MKKSVKNLVPEHNLVKEGKMKGFNTVELLGYFDIVGNVQQRLINASNQFLENQAHQGISPEKNMKLLDRLQWNMTDYGKAHELIVRELAKRFKRDMGVARTPIQIDSMLGQMGEDNPVLKESIESLKEKVKKKKDEADIKKAKATMKKNDKPVKKLK